MLAKKELPVIGRSQRPEKVDYLVIFKNMETFKLKVLNLEQLKAINGGHPLAWLLLGVLISEALDRDASSDFMEGWNDAKKNK